MSKMLSLDVTCHCSRKRTFSYELQVAEQHGGKDRVFIQISCPFSHESYCVKELTIGLPLGIHPADPTIIWRKIE